MAFENDEIDLDYNEDDYEINFDSNKNGKSYTLGEELFNSISHGIGALVSIAAIVLLVVFSPKTPLVITSVSIYGSTLILLYVMSCLYHAFTNLRVKKVFQILDHCSIYLLIAGTYTPYCLVCLKGALGWTIFGIIWGLAVVGITIYSIFKKKARKFNSFTYVLMGWLIFLAFIPLKKSLPSHSFSLLIWGGVLYTLGFPFYQAKEAKWAHSIFHLFVLGGSILHFFSVFEAVRF